MFSHLYAISVNYTIKIKINFFYISLEHLGLVNLKVYIPINL